MIVEVDVVVAIAVVVVESHSNKSHGHPPGQFSLNKIMISKKSPNKFLSFIICLFIFSNLKLFCQEINYVNLTLWPDRAKFTYCIDVKSLPRTDNLFVLS